MKTCSKCGETKPTTDYYKRPETKDGYRNDCKTCFKQAQRTRDQNNKPRKAQYMKQYYANNKDKWDKLHARQYAALKADPEKLEAERRRLRDYRRDRYNNDPDHREAEKARARARYATEHYRVTNRDWRLRKYHEDPDYRARYLDRGHRWRQPTPEDIPVDRNAIYDRDNGTCRICNKPVDRDKFHLDHIVPRKLGGVHRPENLQTTHPACNIRKKANLEGQIGLPL